MKRVFMRWLWLLLVSLVAASCTKDALRTTNQDPQHREVQVDQDPLPADEETDEDADIDPEPEEIDWGAATLVLSPNPASVIIVDHAQEELTYTATLVTSHADQAVSRDVTAETQFSITDAAVGAFDAASSVLRVRAPGPATVKAVHAGKEVTATLEVFAHDERFLDDAPLTAPDVFSAATPDAARSIDLVYPPEEALIPPNLGALDVHFKDATGSDLFAVELRTDYAVLTGYVSANDPDAGAWIAFPYEDWDFVARRAAVGAPIEISVHGVNQTDPASASEARRTLATTRDDLLGALYYIVEDTTFSVERKDLSRPRDGAETYLGPSTRCMSCHAVSPQGDRLAVGYDGAGNTVEVFDVATRQPLAPETQDWTFAAFTPDGQRLLTAKNGVLTLRDAATYDAITTLASSGAAHHPDVSPTGDRVAYVRPTTRTSDWGFFGGALVTTPYDAVAATFGTEVVRVAEVEGVTPSQPAFSPDGAWLAFVRNPQNAFASSDARLWVVKVEGTSEPIPLNLANTEASGLYNSEPSWAPFAATTADGETVFWLTFTSQRDFGVRRVGVHHPGLWLTPFFPARAERGDDPSGPAVWLPFQALQTASRFPKWARAFVPGP